MLTNYKDPRYQKKMLSAMANPLGNKLGIQQNITREWATDQTAWGNQLAQLGLQREIHDDEMKFANDRLKLQRYKFDTGMKNAKEASRLGMYGGLGTTLVAGLMGRQMRQDKEREYALRKKYYDRLSAEYGEGVL